MNDKLRSQVADLVKLHGGQRAFAAAIGVDQSTVSRFITGRSGLSSRLGRALISAYPGLRPSVEAIIFGQDMRISQATRASAVSEEAIA